jgi:hypothetical protein
MYIQTARFARKNVTPTNRTAEQRWRDWNIKDLKMEWINETAKFSCSVTLACFRKHFRTSFVLYHAINSYRILKKQSFHYAICHFNKYPWRSNTREKRPGGKPRLQYLKQVARNSVTESHSNEKNGLQKFHMESCQPIKKLKDKKWSFKCVWKIVCV